MFTYRIHIILTLLLSIIFTPITTEAYMYWVADSNDSQNGNFREIDKYYGISTSYHIVEEDVWSKIESTKLSPACESKYTKLVKDLRSVDETYKLNSQGGWINRNEMNNAQAGLVEDHEKTINRGVSNIDVCLENEQTELEEDAQKEIEKQRELEIEKSLNNCDAQAVSQLTDSERMNNYDRILECENDKQVQDQAVEKVVPVVTTPTVVPTPTPVSTPTPTAPTTTYVPPQTAEVSGADKQDEEPLTDVKSTSTEATSTPEKTITITQEELDKIVEEKLNEKLEETETQSESELKPSFFKRVVDFFFGWF